MKAGNSYMIKMKKGKSNFDLSIYKKAAMQLTANKVFCEYMHFSEFMPVEPEYFVEAWIIRNIIRPDEELKSEIWKYFLENLIDYRKHQGRK
jgi:hypothetical protein